MGRKMIDEVGNKYGRLTVIEQAGTYRTAIVWRCRCDCGNETVVLGIYLRNGHTKSCGCLRKFRKGLAAFNSLYSDYKKGAKRRGYSFELTKEDFSFITKMNCFYCGKEPAQILSVASYNGNYVYNGIDRIDNKKGYILSNIVPCCGTCNRWKRELTYKEFLEHTSKIVHYRNRE